MHLLRRNIAIDRHAGTCFEQVAHHGSTAIAPVSDILNGQLPIKTSVDHRQDMAVQIVLRLLRRRLQHLRKHHGQRAQKGPYLSFVLVRTDRQITKQCIALHNGHNGLLHTIGATAAKDLPVTLLSHLLLVGKASAMAVKIRFDGQAEAAAVDIVRRHGTDHSTGSLGAGMDADTESAIVFQIFKI